jgi:pyroglutamyl-peptidase
MNILLTGFEPFGEHRVNPSQLLIETLPDQILGSSIHTGILPVHHQLGPQKLLELIHQHQPDAVLSFGLAAGRAKISLERVALNLLDYATPDNAGITIENQSIINDAPAAYFSTLPLYTMLTALITAGIPAELSLSAGTYLCNQVFYTLMHTIATENLQIQAGFIHMPALPDQASKSQKPMPSLSLDICIRAAQILIAECIRSTNH